MIISGIYYFLDKISSTELLLSAALENNQMIANMGVQHYQSVTNI